MTSSNCKESDCRPSKIQALVNGFLRAIPWPLRSRVKNVPGLAQLQRIILRVVSDGREFVHTVDAGPAKGIVFPIRLPDDKGIWTGTYETKFSTQLARSIGRQTIAYDIGSWHGFFAGLMSAQGARKVYAFEPLPANAERIRRLISLNASREIELHQCALGAEDTEAEFLIMLKTSMAKLDASPFQRAATAESRIRVTVRSLDSLVAAGQVEAPTFMKIDVEGAELMVLQGALAILRRNRPEIFAEIHSKDLLASCTALLKAEGYDVCMLEEESGIAGSHDVSHIRALSQA